jgi:signal transduction histidine kinase
MRTGDRVVTVRGVRAHAAASWLRQTGRRWGDPALAAALTLFTQFDIWTADSYLEGPKPLFALTTLCMTVPLAFRRRAPFAVSLVVAGALLLQVVLEPSHHPPDAPFLAWVIAAYGVGAHATRGRALVGGVALVAAVGAWGWFTGDDPFVAAVIGGFWLVGRIVHSRNRLAADLDARTRELEAEREERARLAVAEERTRIARELHDVVAHTLGVMVVQAGGERLHETPGTPAYEALSAIERSGRAALTEMGRLVGMLRTESDATVQGPQPGLGRLETLLDGVRETGLRVDLVVEGAPRDLAPGLDVSAYRIVQEALTNTIRHGRSHRAQVRLRWEATALRIEIADDGVGPPAEPVHSGHGLLGIGERVALFGGALVTGRSDLGGYLLAATLPTSP